MSTSQWPSTQISSNTKRLSRKQVTETKCPIPPSSSRPGHLGGERLGKPALLLQTTQPLLSSGLSVSALHTRAKSTRKKNGKRGTAQHLIKPYFPAQFTSTVRKITSPQEDSQDATALSYMTAASFNEVSLNSTAGSCENPIPSPINKPLPQAQPFPISAPRGQWGENKKVLLIRLPTLFGGIIKAVRLVTGATDNRKVVQLRAGGGGGQGLEIAGRLQLWGAVPRPVMPPTVLSQPLARVFGAKRRIRSEPTKRGKERLFSLSLFHVLLCVFFKYTERKKKKILKGARQGGDYRPDDALAEKRCQWGAGLSIAESSFRKSL